MNTPLYSRISKYNGRISFSMPGHKGKITKNLLSCDVTELQTTADLHHDDKYTKEARKLLSKKYKSDESYILTCGSTAAIQTMIGASLNRGDILLASRNCHMSVINTCALLGIKIKIYEGSIPDECKAFIVTSPDYFGNCADIKSLALKCHEKNIPLLVDEAHGAHFIASDKFPKTAMELGADCSCQSAHKTLNALTGAAYLHIKGGLIDRKRLIKLLSMFQTSSPSYAIASSADLARASLSKAEWDKTYEICSRFKKSIKFPTAKNDDMTRIVIDFSGFDISGFEVENILRENGIDIEMADENRAVLIATPWNEESDFSKTSTVINSINTKKTEVHRLPPPPPIPVINPDAFWKKSKEIDFNKSKGYTSAVTITAYPPGTPIIYCGTEIFKEHILYINEIKKQGAKICGTDCITIDVVNEG